MSDFPGRASLFTYAVIYHPKATKEQLDANQTPDSVVLQEPTTILAKNAKEVGVKAARAIPDDHVAHIEDVEIIVRPF